MVRRFPHIVAVVAVAAALGAPPLVPAALAHEGWQRRFLRASESLAAARDDVARAAALIRRADLFRLRGDARSAFADLRAAERAGADPEAVAIGRARVRLDTGRYRALVAAPVPALTRSSALPRLRARAFVALGRAADAAASFESAVALSAQPSVDDYVQWFDALVAAGAPERAADVIECALAELGPIPVLLERAGITVDAAPLRFGALSTARDGAGDGAAPAGPAVVVRGPYLQRTTPTSIVVRWRTDVPTSSRVLYGLDPAALDAAVQHVELVTEHVVELSGLNPATKYHYAVGTLDAMLVGGDADHRFRTAPPIGTAEPTRVWVIGDSGVAGADAADVYSAYLEATGTARTDVWLLLGDNAYPDGTDAEYQAALFDMYPEMLRQTAFWATVGNHDAASSDSATQSGPYYDLVTLPRLGEAGGVPSGTEAYYSFDHGSVHFICLDSSDSPVTPTSPMIEWLELDLAAAADAEWTIAFWHHPPYSKGVHDSDVGAPLIRAREVIVPVLDAHGVDLVLTGHSHSYERSFLLDGHYGTSDTLTPDMILDGGDGRVDGDGAYDKGAGGPHRGAVYIVAGSSSTTIAAPLGHPAMFVGLVELGSVVLEIDGGRLDASFLRETGLVQDWFTMLKSACVNDLDGDGIVGVTELLAVLGDWGASGTPTDLDGDGTVGVGDLLIVLGAWGNC